MKNYISRYLGFIYIDDKISSNRIMFLILLNMCWMLGAILATHYLLGSNPKDIIEYWSHLIVATAAFGVAYWLEK